MRCMRTDKISSRENIRQLKMEIFAYTQDVAFKKVEIWGMYFPQL